MISWYCIWSGHPKIYPEWLGFEGNGSGGVGELCDSLSCARSTHCFPTFSIFCLSCRWKVIVCVVRLLSTGKPLECQRGKKLHSTSDCVGWMNFTKDLYTGDQGSFPTRGHKSLAFYFLLFSIFRYLKNKNQLFSLIMGWTVPWIVSSRPTYILNVWTLIAYIKS